MSENTPKLPARNAKGHLLPGHCGVPGSGRPKGLAKMVRDSVDFEKVLETLKSMAYGKLAPTIKAADRLKACEILLERGYGRAVQHVEISEGETLQPKANVSTDELIRARDELAALLDGETQGGRKLLGNVIDAELVEVASDQGPDRDV